MNFLFTGFVTTMLTPDSARQLDTMDSHLRVYFSHGSTSWVTVTVYESQCSLNLNTTMKESLVGKSNRTGCVQYQCEEIRSPPTGVANRTMKLASPTESGLYVVQLTVVQKDKVDNNLLLSLLTLQVVGGFLVTTEVNVSASEQRTAARVLMPLWIERHSVYLVPHTSSVHFMTVCFNWTHLDQLSWSDLAKRCSRGNPLTKSILNFAEEFRRDSSWLETDVESMLRFATFKVSERNDSWAGALQICLKINMSLPVFLDEDDLRSLTRHLLVQSLYPTHVYIGLIKRVTH